MVTRSRQHFTKGTYHYSAEIQSPVSRVALAQVFFPVLDPDFVKIFSLRHPPPQLPTLPLDKRKNPGRRSEGGMLVKQEKTTYLHM